MFSNKDPENTQHGMDAIQDKVDNVRSLETFEFLFI